MNTRKTTLTTALLAAFVVIGIGSVPVTAVPADCSKDFEIKTGKPTLARVLFEDLSETGWIEVTGTEKTTVRVELDSDDSVLRFGVFVADGGCVAAGSSSPDCGTDEKLQTETLAFPQHKDCEIDPGETYYFHIVNVGNETAMYRAWELA